LESGFFWKFGFLVGLLSGSLPLYWGSENGVYKLGSDFEVTLFDSNEVSSSNLNIAGWVIGGFLVGVGTKLGNGCTSGHGICGLPRLSIRSWIAVPTFMGCGFVMATIRYYTGLFETG
jgi:uncharacterized protein